MGLADRETCRQPGRQCELAPSTRARTNASPPRRAAGGHRCHSRAHAAPGACGDWPQGRAGQLEWGRGKKVDGNGIVPRGFLIPALLPDAALLAGVPEDILCFSRSFEDLTCFWDEKEAVSGMCHFYYWYNR